MDTLHNVLRKGPFRTRQLSSRRQSGEPRYTSSFPKLITLDHYLPKNGDSTYISQLSVVTKLGASKVQVSTIHFGVKVRPHSLPRDFPLIFLARVSLKFVKPNSRSAYTMDFKM